MFKISMKGRNVVNTINFLQEKGYVVVQEGKYLIVDPQTVEQFLEWFDLNV